MKYLKTFEQIESVSSPLSRIKFLVDEFKTGDEPLNKNQFTRQLNYIFTKYLDINNVEDFTNKIVNNLDTDESTKSIVLDTFKDFLKI
jgi:hypothetical protein